MIGPQRLFSHGHLYYGLTYLFLVGAIAPVIQWTLHKKLRLDVLKYLNFPIIFAGAANLPPSRDTFQLCTLGARLLGLSPFRPSPLPWLVVQIQL